MADKKVLVPLAQGCEEIEAVTIIDILVRGFVQVTTVSLDDETIITASRGVKLIADKTLADVENEIFDMVVLPGGLAGANHLESNQVVIQILQDTIAAGKRVAAICAAPKVLVAAGLLTNKKATSYPGFINTKPAEGMQYLTDKVVNDGLVTTSQGPGTAMDFALELLGQLQGEAIKLEVKQALLH